MEDPADPADAVETPAVTPSDEESEKAILKALLAERDGTKWTPEDLDIPTLNGGLYEVRTANELAYLLEFGSTKGEKYRLMADINVSESSIAELFTSEIGAEPFENFEFDGNGKTISGLDLPFAAGLFSRVKDSRIYNFTLASCTVGSANNVSNLLGTGAVVGTASGTVEVSSVTVSSCNVYAPCKLGGFVGALTDGTATFTSCDVSATNVNGIDLKGISGWCGGFVGFVGRIKETDKSSSVNVTFTDCDIDGGSVKPYMKSTLRTCGQFLGMLIGFDSNETVTMTGCDVQTTYTGQDDKSQVNPHYKIGGHKYGNGVILVDGLTYVYPWDGKTTKKPALTNGVYDVYTAEELAWFQGKTETTNKIHIHKDIDLAGQPFTPIKEVKTLEGLKEDGTNSEIRNLKINFKHTTTGYGGAFINYVNTAGTEHQNINFRGADIYVSHDDTYPAELTNPKQYGNGYAGTLCSRVDLSTTTSKAYTVRNVHCYDGKIDAVCKMGGLLGGSWGTLTVENCSVEGYWIENRLVDCKNAYSKETSVDVPILGIQTATCYAEFFTEGECGGLIGFIARNSTISDCSVINTKVKCYGQEDQVVAFGGDLGSLLGQMQIPGRHVNQFIGDIRTESSDASKPITVNIIEPTVSGNAYLGASGIYKRNPLGDTEISADSSEATNNDYNHSWSGSNTPYIGCAYYVGAEVHVKILSYEYNKQMGDYPGSVTVTKNGTLTPVEVFGGRTGGI